MGFLSRAQKLLFINSIIDINLMAKSSRAIGWKLEVSHLLLKLYHGVSLPIKHSTVSSLTLIHSWIVISHFCRIVHFIHTNWRTAKATPAFPLMSIEKKTKCCCFFIEIAIQSRNKSDKFINEHFPLKPF